MPKFVLLAADIALWALMALAIGYMASLRRRPSARRVWASAFRGAPALCSAVVLAAMALVAMVDSVHFRRTLPSVPGGAAAYAPTTESLLDRLLEPLRIGREVSYSAPLAMRAMNRTTALEGARGQQVHQRLVHGGAGLEADADRPADVVRRLSLGALCGTSVALSAAAALAAVLARADGARVRSRVRDEAARLWHGRTRLPWRAALVTLSCLCILAGMGGAVGAGYHVLGTDRTGNDVLYQALKSLRTAFVVGGLSTLATLPFAITLGIAAGYCRGWVDDVVTYVYTVLSSTPNVLLIAASVLPLQTTLDAHPDWMQTGAERADLRLVLLCLVLGCTTWATLCRLLRAETIRLCGVGMVQAAQASGLGPLRIMWRHLLPNLAHLVLITTVLDFSSLVLYEAVLSFIGIGVDPTMNSYGHMIDLARTELAREPLVWWSFAAAFAFMVTLVLAANLVADGVRDAFDPRAGHRPGRRAALLRRRSA